MVIPNPFGFIFAITPEAILRNTVKGLYELALQRGYNKTQTATFLGTNRRTLQRAVDSNFESLKFVTMDAMLNRVQAREETGWQQTGRFSQRINTVGMTQNDLAVIDFSNSTQPEFWKYQVVRLGNQLPGDTPEAEYITETFYSEAELQGFFASLDTPGNVRSGTIESITFRGVSR